MVKRPRIIFFALRIRAIEEEQRDKIIEEIVKKNVAVNVHFIPMPMLSFFRELGYNIIDYPISYQNYKAEISLPIYPQLSEFEIKYVVEAVKEAYKIVLRPK